MKLWITFFVFIVPSFVLYGQVSKLPQGNTLWQEGQYADAYQVYQEVETEAKSTKDTSLLAYAQMFQGKYHAKMGHLDTARLLLDSVMAWESILGTDHPAVILAHRASLNLVQMQGNILVAIPQMEALVEQVNKLPANADSLKAMCGETLGNAYLQLNELDKAMAIFRKVRQIRQAIYPPNHVYLAYGNNAMGSIYLWNEMPDSARYYLAKAESMLIAHFDETHPHVLMVRTNLAVLLNDLGLTYEAVEKYERIALNLEQMAPINQVITLLNYGSSQMGIGRYESALETFSLAENMLNASPGLFPNGFGYIESERANIYRSLSRYDEALNSNKKSLRKKTELFGEEDESLIQDWVKQGLIYQSLGKPELASKAFQKALKLGKKHLSPHATTRAQAWEFYGESLIEQGAYTRALDVLGQAQKAYEGSSVSWNMADVYVKMADAWHYLQDWDAVESYHQKAWAVIDPSLDNKQMNPDTHILDHWRMYPVANMLDYLTIHSYTRYQQTQEVTWLQHAYQANGVFIALQDSQRLYMGDELSKTSHQGRMLEAYENQIRYAIELYTATRDPHYEMEAFLWAEKSKAHILREQFRLKGNEVVLSGVPAEILSQEKTLRQQLRYHADPLISPDSAVKYSQHLSAYQQLIGHIQKAYPAYFQLRFGQPQFTADEFIEQIKPGTYVYSYFWGDTTLYVFRLGKEGVKIYTNPHPTEDLRVWLTETKEGPTASRSENAWIRVGMSAFQLSQTLLPRFPEDAQEIVLIPHGPLAHLSFETLLMQRPVSANFVDWDFLMKKCPITYTYAGEVWLQQQKRTSAFATHYTGIAPVFSQPLGKSRNAEWPSALVYNQKEVRAAASLFGGEAWQDTSISKAKLLGLSGENRILHFATHANTSQAPMEGVIFLGAEGEENLLTEKEIYGQNWSTPLTVLSACQTGTGVLQPGESVMSFARAFQYAGSDRVLASIWTADDEASAFLMNAFFEHVSEGEDVSYALQQSRMSYLAQSDRLHSHPYFWGGFVLVGKNGPVWQSQTSGIYMVIGFGLFALGLMLKLRQEIGE